MAAYCSSPSASSSAVTIPTPGKSILKRPPPPQQSIFSRLSKFLPTTNANATTSNTQGSQEDETRPLKRAHFILPEIAIVYPISSLNPPSTPSLKDEKRAIEDREYERRRRVVRGPSQTPGAEPEGWWNMEKVESFYRECCEGCDEAPDPAISAAFKNAAHTNPRTVDLSGVQLTVTSASILSDVFSIEWGLHKLVFRECDLDELTIKPILHSLLIPGSLSFLSVASNRRLKALAFRLISAYVKKSKTLRFLDLAQNNLDKKSVEYIVTALDMPPEQGLESLRLDDCSLRPAALEVLCRAVRTSSLKHISLRHNRLSSTGAVALALMIRDYPDTMLNSISISPTPSYSASGHRHDVSLSQSTANNSTSSGSGTRHDTGPSAALLDRVRALDALPRLGALRTLDLKGNDLRNGITYLAQVLKRNRTLKLLNLSENKLDVGCLVAIAEALKYNSCLETLDMSKNPCSGPSLDGIQSLRTAFTLNTSLKRLFLSSSHLISSGAIALAEFLPESTSLLHLDLTNNHLDLAGVMALNKGLKSNHVMRCLDLNIPPGDEAFAKMCREILNTCVRNTEEAERNSKRTTLATSTITSGRGQKRGVWGLIEESELAKSIRKDEERKVYREGHTNTCTKHGVSAVAIFVYLCIADSTLTFYCELAKSIRKDEERKIEKDILTRARNMVSQLSQFLSTPVLPVPPSPSTPFSPGQINAPNLNNQQQSLDAITTASGAIVVELRTAIAETATKDDTERLAQLLGVNDELLALLKHIPSLASSGSGGSHLEVGDANSLPSDSSAANTNGVTEDLVEDEEDEEDEEDATPTTPRIDKGKGRAEPEGEEPEKVLSPSYVIDSEDSDEEDERRLMVPEEMAAFMPSPTERSRSWVEEEGEIFRKGNVLLGPEELEGEYAGEELRKELLEAMVERPPPRPINDEFEIDGILSQGFDPIDGNVPFPTTEQPSKPPPRPYIPRRTSSSIMGVISPALSGNASPDSGGNDSGNGNGGSPHALAHVPTFVRRTRSTDSAGSESTVS
ncbi:Protein phosphatase 1 regulatory subunit 37 [Leucoagaricus sp. SymC.cos]|nr:Protein phosphatase 1 regulatory subunit 37 [Leucoagaricus sp. SymC.cos]